MTARLLVGDVRTRIKEIPDASIDVVVTSPPFLALRRYGDNTDAEMGSEPNPAAFIDALLELTGEFRRVLAPHGSIAVELGDTYSGSGGAGGDYNDNGLRAGQNKVDGPAKRQAFGHNPGDRSNVWAPNPYGSATITRERGPFVAGGSGWPLSKSLAGVPEAYMLSLAYGWNVLNRDAPDSPAGRWRVRNVIVWARPNPPVGALGDKVRPATSYITVACTSDKRWFDLDAVRTEAQVQMGRAVDGNNVKGSDAQSFRFAQRVDSNPAGAPPLDWCEDNDSTGHATLILPTQPYPGAHYATWPPTLAKRLIDMLCPLRVCTVCGEPSRRIVGDAEYLDRNTGKPVTPSRFLPGSPITGKLHDGGTRVTTVAPTLGWSDCGHDTWRKGHVLDPFSGSATTLSVAHGCGRDATGIELYESNSLLSQDRMGFFLEVS